MLRTFPLTCAPLALVTVAGVPANALGWAYAANTGAIVLGQLYALRVIQGRRRSAMLAVCAAT